MSDRRRNHRALKPIRVLSSVRSAGREAPPAPDVAVFTNRLDFLPQLRCVPLTDRLESEHYHAECFLYCRTGEDGELPPPSDFTNSLSLWIFRRAARHYKKRSETCVT